MEERAQIAAIVLAHLAADQVERLDAVGAFVDLRDPGIAHVLLHAVLADVAVAAEDLHAEIGDIEPRVGAHGLHDRGEQLHQIVRRLAFFRRRRMAGDVLVDRHPHGQGAHAFGHRLHGQQVLAHIRVHDQRVRRLLGRDRAFQAAALEPFTRIEQAVLQRHLGEAEALNAHAQTRGVHHREHRPHAFVLLAHQPAGGVVEIDDAGGGGLDAHLVLDRAARDAVPRADAAVRLRHELRHHEQADAFNARGRIRQLRQHQVHDVLGKVVLAGGDEDLGAGDGHAAVVLRNRLGADEAEVRAAMRLGQAHRAAPGAFHELRQIGLLLLLGAVDLDGVIGAVGQAGIHRERHVGGAQHLLHQGVYRFRQTLAAVFGARRGAGPAAFDELLIGFLEAARRAHHAVLEGAAFLVAGAVEGEQHLGTDLAGFLEHGVDQVVAEILIALVGLQAAAVEQFAQHELHVAKRGVVNTHGVSPSSGAVCRCRACVPCAPAFAACARVR